MAPPAELSAEEAAVWTAIAAARPSDWFGAGSAPLLSAYCRAVCDARRIAGLLAALDPKSLDTKDGLARYDKLLAMRDRQARLVATLATKMRLSQQSKYGARGAEAAARGSSPSPVKPWDYQPTRGRK